MKIYFKTAHQQVAYAGEGLTPRLQGMSACHMKPLFNLKTVTFFFLEMHFKVEILKSLHTSKNITNLQLLEQYHFQAG